MTSTAPAIIEKAGRLYARGLCDQAIGMLSQALQADPARQDILSQLVELLIDSGQHREALRFLEEAIAGRADAPPCVSVALCHEALGECGIAEKIARYLIGIPAQRGEAISLLGRIAMRCGNHALAQQRFQEAIAADSRCASACLGMGHLLREQGDTPDSLAYFERAFNLRPDSREIALTFHESAVALEQGALAETAFRRALALHPLNRRLRFLLIDLLLNQGKYDEAMPEIEACMVDFGVDDGILQAALSIRKRIAAPPSVRDKGKGGTVSLCMIVKNEENHLARCLRSAKPLVAEIIVVDTGSTDRTKDIAAVFGAQVWEFAWNDNFSEARNFGLSKAAGEWILVLDADEALSGGDHENLRKILAAARGRPAAYRIRTRNYSNQMNTVGFRMNRGEFAEEEGLGWFPSDKVRLFANDPRIRFDYPVHELVEPSLKKLKIPVSGCPIVVHHYGTLKDATTLEKTRKYRELDRNKLMKHPKGAAALKELAIQSMRVAKHAEALGFWRRFIRLQPRSAEAYLNMGTACWNLGRFEAAFSFAEKASRIDGSLKEAPFNMAIALLFMGRGQEAKTRLAGLVRQQPDYLAARFLFCVACICVRDLDGAGRSFEILRTSSLGGHIDESFLDIAKRLLNASRGDYARRTIAAALGWGCDTSELRAVLKACGGSPAG